MDKFVSLVAVKHEEYQDRSFLFEAPISYKIGVGSLVVVDTQYGEKLGRATAVHDFIRVGSDHYNFIVAAMGATEPLKKVIGVFTPLKYEEEE